MSPFDPSSPDSDGYEDVLALLSPTELAMPTTLAPPTSSARRTPPPSSELAAAIERDADEAWSLAVAFLGDEEAAWEAVVDGFVRLGRTPKAGLATSDTLRAQAEALQEVARLLAKSGSLPEVHGAALPPATRLALLLQTGFAHAGFAAAQPAELRRALVLAYPHPGHARGDELCALLADDVLGTLSAAGAETLEALRREHPTSAALIHARYLEATEVPLLVQPRIDELCERVAAQLAREAEHVEAVEALQLQTAVRCAYCHDRLRRVEAAFCASCLAPHHADCFASHGLCSAPGCAETRLVRPHEAAPARPAWRRRAPWLAAGLVGLGAAAWSLASPGDLDARPPTPAPDPALLAEAQALSDSAKAKRDARAAARAAFTAELNARKTSLDFPETPLADCLSFLRDIGGLNLVLSPGARELIADLGSDSLLRLKLEDVGLLSALELVLSANPALTYRVEPDVVVVELEGESQAELVLQAYPVGDLLNGEARAHGGLHFELHDALIEIMEQLLCPDEEGSLELSGASLVVRKSEATHAKLSRLLEQFRSGHGARRETPAWERPLRAALDREVETLALTNSPLPFAVEALRASTGAPILLCPGVEREQVVTLDLRALPLRDVLTLLGEQAGLTWRLRSEAIVLEERDRWRLDEFRLEIFDVSDLLAWLDPDKLEETLTGATGEERWDDPAWVEVVGDRLLVRQTEPLQRALAEALAELRVSRARNQSASGR